jgi:hypothetical protein
MLVFCAVSVLLLLELAKCPHKHEGQGITYESVGRCQCNMLHTSITCAHFREFATSE